MRINANTFIYHMVMAQALLYIGSFISAPNGLHYHITLDDCIDQLFSDVIKMSFQTPSEKCIILSFVNHEN